MNGVKIVAKYSKHKNAKPIRICRYETKQSQENFAKENFNGKNLLIKSIPKEVSAHQFYKVLRVFGDIRSCKLVVNFKCESKGYGYVSYYNLEAAERAKKEMSENGINGKKLIAVNLQRGLSTNSKLKNNIYVKNIPKENFSDENLKVFLNKFSNSLSNMVK